MIRPPPESFQTTRTAMRPMDDGPPASVRALTWGVTALVALGLHVGIYLAATRTSTALVALGLHVGIYLAATRTSPAPPAAPPQPPAAVMINMAPIAMSVKSQTDNATDQPEAPESQQLETAVTEEAPPPPAPDPVVTVPPPPPEVKPQAALPPTPPKKEVRKAEKPPEKPVKKDTEKPKRPVEKRDEKRVASKSGGGPKSDRNDARTAASAAGTAASEVSRASWLGELRSRIMRSKRRPPDARGKFGVALVSITIAANGSVSNVRVLTSSGVPSLDAEAVAVMYRAAPYPPPPTGKPTPLSIPLNFN